MLTFPGTLQVYSVPPRQFCPSISRASFLVRSVPSNWSSCKRDSHFLKSGPGAPQVQQIAPGHQGRRHQGCVPVGIHGVPDKLPVVHQSVGGKAVQAVKPSSSLKCGALMNIRRVDFFICCTFMKRMWRHHHGAHRINHGIGILQSPMTEISRAMGGASLS